MVALSKKLKKSIKKSKPLAKKVMIHADTSTIMPNVTPFRMETMKQEIAQLRVEQRLTDMQWTGKEETYKKTIQKLQSKVGP